jgi:hypothetical protein
MAQIVIYSDKARNKQLTLIGDRDVCKAIELAIQNKPDGVLTREDLLCEISLYTNYIDIVILKNHNTGEIMPAKKLISYSKILSQLIDLLDYELQEYYIQIQE